MLDVLLGSKKGHEYYGMYWLLMEALTQEFKKDDTSFQISSNRLCAILRVKYDKKVERFLEVLTEIAQRFDEDLFKIESISSKSFSKIYKIDTPIILELMGKDFKRTRARSGQTTAKKEKQKEKQNIIEVSDKSIELLNDYNSIFGKKLTYKTHGEIYTKALKKMTQDDIMLSHKYIKSKVDDSSWSVPHMPINLFGRSDSHTKRLGEIEAMKEKSSADDEFKALFSFGQKR